MSAYALAFSRVSRPEASRAARPCDEADRLLALAGREVVQQDQVGARVDDLAQLVQGVDLDLDRHVREGLPYGLEGLRDAARGDHVVVLDEGRVRERHPVVDAAAAADRELLQGAQPGSRLAGVADLRLRALQGVRPRARGGRDAGQAAQEVERAALGGEQVTRARGDRQELLPGLHAVAVLHVPLDLELVRADHRDHRFGDPEARHDARLARGEVGGGDGLFGDGRDGRHVHAVVEVLLDGDVGDVLDLHGVESGVGQELRERGVEPALQVLRRRSSRATGAAVAAAAARAARGKVGGAHFCHCSWGRSRLGLPGRGEVCGIGGVYGERAVRIQPYDDVAAPGRVVAVGVVLAPVAAAGLLAQPGGGDQDAGHAQEVGGLPGVDAGLGRLAVLVEGVARPRRAAAGAVRRPWRGSRRSAARPRPRS